MYIYKQKLSSGIWSTAGPRGSASASQPPARLRLEKGKVHPCNFDHAYAGFEVMIGMFRSAARGGQVVLPLADGADELAELQRAVSSAPLSVTLEESRKEYGP
jgi:hypothetical protein